MICLNTYINNVCEEKEIIGMVVHCTNPPMEKCMAERGARLAVNAFPVPRNDGDWRSPIVRFAYSTGCWLAVRKDVVALESVPSLLPKRISLLLGVWVSC